MAEAFKAWDFAELVPTTEAFRSLIWALSSGCSLKEKQQLSLLKAATNTKCSNKTIGLLVWAMCSKLDDFRTVPIGLAARFKAAKVLPCPKMRHNPTRFRQLVFKAWGDSSRAKPGYTKAVSSNMLYIWPNLGCARKSISGHLLLSAATESCLIYCMVTAQTNRLSVLYSALPETKVLFSNQIWIKDTYQSNSSDRSTKFNFWVNCLKQATSPMPHHGQNCSEFSIPATFARSINDQRTQSVSRDYLGGLYTEAQNQPDIKRNLAGSNKRGAAQAVQILPICSNSK